MTRGAKEINAMNCRDVRELADSFLSQELLTETNHEILRHVESCMSCRTEIEMRRQLRASLRRAFDRTAELRPADELTDLVRERLRQSTRSQPRAFRALRTIRWWALAASTIAAVGASAALWSSGWLTVAGRLARVAAADHRYCTLESHFPRTRIPLEQAATYGAAYRVLVNTPAEDISVPGGVAKVIERHSCVFRGRRFAHIELRYHGTLVSLLVASEGEGLPDGGRASQPPSMTEWRVDSLSVVSWPTTGYSVFLVGGLAPADLRVLAKSIADLLPPRLSGV
jgi:predicted anti-sigma-YlaC factor YlaD